MKTVEIFFLVCLLANYSRSEHLLHTVDGVVGRGNYTYYSLMYDGSITLFLYTISGDADLYVSQLNQKPTYEPESYCLQSSTCGLDVVYITSDFKRPVGIGVYGHPSHEFSEYELEVYSSEYDHNNESLGSHLEADGVHTSTSRESQLDSADYEKFDSAKQDEDPGEESVFWTLIWSFFDILVEILFL